MRSGPEPGGSAANAAFVCASSSAIGNTGSARPLRARSSQSWYQPITVTRWPASSVPDQTPRASSAVSGPARTSSPPIDRLGADDVRGAETLELRVGDAQLPQHVVGVLPE